MRILALMRHAEAEERHSGGDRLRGLTERGRSQARSAGALLARMEIIPSFIIHSGAARTVETMRRMEAAWESGNAPETKEDSRLYSLPFEAAPLLQAFDSIIARADDEARCLLVLGHNPSISHLAFLLNGSRAGPFTAGFPPASCAVFESAAESWALFDPRACTPRIFILNGTDPVDP